MPAPRPSLTSADVHRIVRDDCFPLGGLGRVGIELEWLTWPRSDPHRIRRVSERDVRAAVEQALPLPGGGAVTFEPGGQVEVSTLPYGGPSKAIGALAVDRAALISALADRGVALVGLGLDPHRPPRRVLDTPRYRAMEAYFDRQGRAGRTMMCATAAVQVNVDVGPAAGLERRWRLAHDLAPTLAAAFANSPFRRGRPSGWKSTRLGNWSVIDRDRTRPAHGDGTPARAADAWVDYALTAPVMLVRSSEDEFVVPARRLPFGRWLTEGHELGWPTADDFAYHLTTLFPPVRPRGRLELRAIDALPDPWWRVAVGVSVALLDDEEAADRAAEIVARAGAAGRWIEAARDGLAHPALGAAARGCLPTALDGLERLGADRATITAAADFVERFVERGRCPADDLLDAWADDHTGPPALETCEGERWS